MRGGGAVELQAGNPRLPEGEGALPPSRGGSGEGMGIGIGEIIERIRQMQQVILDIGPIALAVFEVAGGRAHEEIPRPQARKYMLMRRCTSTSRVPLRSFCSMARDSFESRLKYLICSS
jgi:hypothetical protein